MTNSYDLNELLSHAREWREHARTAFDITCRDECCRQATRCEQLVMLSLETPPIVEAGNPKGDWTSIGSA